LATPTVSSRLKRRFIVASAESALLQRVRAATPPGWEAEETLDIGAIGGFEEILQYRFVLLDLEIVGDRDPVELVAELRSQLMLNIPIFCFGGDAALRDAARLARADRFFDRDEIEVRLAQFCDQFGWGG